MAAFFDVVSGIFGPGGLAGSVIEVLKSTGVLKDPELQAKMQTELLKYEWQVKKALSNEMESINKTMRAEAKSDKFLQYSWRPIVGYTFSAVLINNYIILPYLARFGAVPIDIPGQVWTAMLVVLGAAAGTRGIEKWQRAKGGK